MYIADMGYADFVGATGQENAPPGGSATFHYWATEGAIDEHSHILDFACSTGLTSRRLASMTGCRTTGIDLSSFSIEEARRRAALEEVDCAFLTGDAAQLPFSSQSFTHVAAGSCFGFIQEREAALREVRRVLEPAGKLLIACRYYERRPTAGLLDALENALGYRPDPQRGFEWWKRFFASCFSSCESQHLLFPTPTPEEELAQFDISLEKPDHPLHTAEPAVRADCRVKFREVRELIYENNLHQGVVLICLSA